MPDPAAGNPSTRLDQIAHRIEAAWPATHWVPKDTIVAVSGGCDSVGLLRALLHIRQQTAGSGQLIVAHCHHQLGGQSDRHAAFVSQLAQRLNLPCHVVYRGRRPEADQAWTRSEQALREIRYKRLVQFAQQSGARYIVTGHTADDQIETVLFRLFRGSGLSGLQGIPFIRVQQGVSIVRPLLSIRRHEIASMLRDLDQDWESDSSNLESGFTRNFLRNEVIPLVADRFGPAYADAIVRLARHSQEYERLLDELSDETVAAARCQKDRLEIPIRSLSGLPDLVQRHAVKRVWRAGHFPEQQMNQVRWMRLAALVGGNTGQQLPLPGKIHAIRQQASLVLVRRRDS